LEVAFAFAFLLEPCRLFFQLEALVAFEAFMKVPDLSCLLKLVIEIICLSKALRFGGGFTWGFDPLVNIAICARGNVLGGGVVLGQCD
jgi:hypothetical protein